MAAYREDLIFLRLNGAGLLNLNNMFIMQFRLSHLSSAFCFLPKPQMLQVSQLKHPRWKFYDVVIINSLQTILLMILVGHMTNFIYVVILLDIDVIKQ